jgi:hypothetical protein
VVPAVPFDDDLLFLLCCLQKYLRVRKQNKIGGEIEEDSHYITICFCILVLILTTSLS